MFNSVLELQDFYSTEIGGIVRSILVKRIHNIWPNVKGLRVMGAGYATPFLSGYLSEAERVIAMMPERQGVCKWPQEGRNLALVSYNDALPIENVSVDRIILAHYMEGCENLHEALCEVWRVLKPNGRVLVIVPNRLGLWARSDWSPFGNGHPFTMSQAIHCMKYHNFIPEYSESALFVPPMPDSPVMMKSANLIEHMGHKVFPFVAGVHIIECSKQVYAKVDNSGSGSAVFEKTKGFLAGKPVATRS